MKLKNFLLILLLAALPVFSQNAVSSYQGIVSYLVDVARGRVHGESIINKFGHNPAVPTGGADIWPGGGVYSFYPDTAKSLIVLCDSSADSVGGAGALTLKVYGLDSGFAEINETITLTGSDSVDLVNTYKRVYRAIVLTAGSYGTNKGAITIRVSGGDTAAIISADDGQTQQAIYTIPAGKVGYFLKGYVSMDNDDKNGVDANFRIKARPYGGAWVVKGQVQTINIGSSWFSYEYGAPAGPFTAKTDIKIECFETSATSGASAAFDILLVAE